MVERQASVTRRFKNIELDVAGLADIISKMSERAGAMLWSLSTTVGADRLTFNSIQELCDTPEVPDTVANFTVRVAGGDRRVILDVDSSSGLLVTVGPDSGWCDGTVAQVTACLRRFKRRSYFAPLMFLGLLILALMIWTLVRRWPVMSVSPWVPAAFGFCVGMVGAAITFTLKRFYVPCFIIRLRPPRPGFLSRNATKVDLWVKIAVPIVAAIVAGVLGWFLRGRSTP